MLTALILVCSLASVRDRGDCTRDNAIAVLKVPAAFASPAACFTHAQAYVADSSIGRDLAPNEALKVVCVGGASVRIDQAERQP